MGWLLRQLNAPAAGKKARNREWIAEVRRKKGLPPLDPAAVPDTEEDEQDFLPAHLHWIWSAFATLSRARLVNQAGPQPIPVSEVSAYCEIEGWLDAETRADLLFHITNLDGKWLEIRHAEIAKQMEKTRKDAANKGNRRQRR